MAFYLYKFYLKYNFYLFLRRFLIFFIFLSTLLEAYFPIKYDLLDYKKQDIAFLFDINYKHFITFSLSRGCFDFGSYKSITVQILRGQPQHLGTKCVHKDQSIGGLYFTKGFGEVATRLHS